MTEWWSVLAVFWILFLADGVLVGRRARHFFHGWRAGRDPRALTSHATWSSTLPLPSAWTLAAEDLGLSLSEEGLSNWPVGASGRPPPLPDAVVFLTWEAVSEVAERAGWIHVNGRRFVPASPGLSAKQLSVLAQSLGPLAAGERARVLQAWHARRLEPHHLQRRLKVVLHHTRLVSRLNAAQLIFMGALTAYIVGGGPEIVPPFLRDGLVDAVPFLLAGYLLVHVLAVVEFRRVHRRFFPAAKSERNSLLVTIALVPPQALRLRRLAILTLAHGQHPLAVALAAARPEAEAEICRNTLGDLRWPRRPATMPDAVMTHVSSARKLVEPLMTATIRSVRPRFEAELLFAAPEPDNARSCLYCPRCGDQFTRPDASCPHGVTLLCLANTNKSSRS